jgi:hypothetical protein
LLSAAFNLVSSLLDSDVFSTRGLYGSTSGSTLSSVTLLTNTNRGIVSPSFLHELIIDAEIGQPV